MVLPLAFRAGQDFFAISGRVAWLRAPITSTLVGQLLLLINHGDFLRAQLSLVTSITTEKTLRLR